MAGIGFFDGLALAKGWFDNTAEPSGWFDVSALSAATGDASVNAPSVSVACVVGSVSVSAAVSVGATGVSSSVLVGAVTAIVNVSAAPSGVSAAVPVGTVNATGSAVKAATGVSSAVVVVPATITAGASISVTGVSSQTQIGEVAATVDGGGVDGIAEPAGVSTTLALGKIYFFSEAEHVAIAPEVSRQTSASAERAVSASKRQTIANVSAMNRWAIASAVRSTQGAEIMRAA